MFNLRIAETRVILPGSLSRKADHAPRSKTIVFDRPGTERGLWIDGGIL